MADILRGFAVLVWLQYLVQSKEFLQVIPSPPFEIFISEKISPVDNSSLTTSLLSGHYRSSFHPPLFLFPLSFRSQKNTFYTSSERLVLGKVVHPDSLVHFCHRWSFRNSSCLAFSKSPWLYFRRAGDLPSLLVFTNGRQPSGTWRQ